jgi:hypothetical protein
VASKQPLDSKLSEVLWSVVYKEKKKWHYNKVWNQCIEVQGQTKDWKEHWCRCNVTTEEIQQAASIYQFSSNFIVEHTKLR